MEAPKGLRFCCAVKRVQLKNVTVDVMNIIVTITVGVKFAAERIEMYHFEGENTKISRRGQLKVWDGVWERVFRSRVGWDLWR